LGVFRLSIFPVCPEQKPKAIIASKVKIILMKLALYPR
jgi:hypothetical protein